MRRFTKGSIETVVDDDDKRIAAYLANGWKEEATKPKAADETDKATDKALTDVAESEKPKSKGKKNPTAKKVNDTIKANSAAASEGEAVDDGLFKKEGK